MRLKQWVKNVLVTIPFLSSGKELSYTNIRLIIFGFISFSLASSLVYITNDWNDRSADRLHETKSQRPIASGDISGESALLLSLGLAFALIAFLFNMNFKFIFCILIYLINSFVYTFFIKKLAILEMFSVSLGFMLRGFGGAAMLSISLSSWFLLVTWFSSLYIVLGKREAEWRTLSHASTTRPVLQHYSGEFLRDAKVICMGATLTSYCSWALYGNAESVLAVSSIIPLCIFLFSYANELAQGGSESPEIIVLGNRTILLSLSVMFLLIYLNALNLYG